jgi:dTDP-4-amino-4,6-dideoxygalactose transaminase
MSSSDLALFGGPATIPPNAHRLWPAVEREEEEAVLAVLRRGVLSGPDAPAATMLEDAFAGFCEAKYALLTHCGTSALQIALAAAGAGPGDEVIVPAYSFIATPLSVLQQGAVPIFVDVAGPHWTIDVRQVEAAVSERTKAVLPVHIHGCPADMDELIAIARRHGLAVIEDAAQAHGATYKGRAVGAIGDAGAFSFQSGKNLAAGEGGVFVTNDEKLAQVANQIRNFGQDAAIAERGFDSTRPLDGHREMDCRRLGWMFRGNEMMAAFAHSQLTKLPMRTKACQQNAARLSAALSDLPGVTPPAAPADRTTVHHKYRVQLDPGAAGLPTTQEALRDQTALALRAEGLEVVLWESKPLVAQGIFANRQADALRRADPRRLEENYDPLRYPNTAALLNGSIVLFSQSYPLIAQSAEIVDLYAEAFRKVWAQRDRLVGSAALLEREPRLWQPA